MRIGEDYLNSRVGRVTDSDSSVGSVTCSRRLSTDRPSIHQTCGLLCN